MYGATRILCEDFDQDGDLDVAASAYFPDFSSGAPRSFVYFENASDDSLVLTPHTLSHLEMGRWLVMEPLRQSGEAAPSIMLGSFNLGPELGLKEETERWNAANINLMILENVGGSNP